MILIEVFHKENYAKVVQRSLKLAFYLLFLSKLDGKSGYTV